MKYLILLTVLCSAFNTNAQVLHKKSSIDTVVIRVDSTFESLIHRKLNNYRNQVKYQIFERGRIRELIIYLASVEDLVTGHKLYGIRIDQRGSRNIFTDAPMTNAEYIDEDEIEGVLNHLKFIRDEVKNKDVDSARYTEYRYFTRAGFMIETYTGNNRWRTLLHYEINKFQADVYLNNGNRLEELIETLEEISKEILEWRKIK